MTMSHVNKQYIESIELLKGEIAAYMHRTREFLAFTY